MTTFDFSPLFRSTVGFDRMHQPLFGLLGNGLRGCVGSVCVLEPQIVRDQAFQLVTEGPHRVHGRQDVIPRVLGMVQRVALGVVGQHVYRTP